MTQPTPQPMLRLVAAPEGALSLDFERYLKDLSKDLDDDALMWARTDPRGARLLARFSYEVRSWKPARILGDPRATLVLTASMAFLLGTCGTLVATIFALN